MQTIKNIVSFLGLTMVIGAVIGVPTYAQISELDEQKIAIIKQTCVSAQVNLQRIQNNDAASRVNRGQGYETLLSSLITPLNSRAALNGFASNATELNAITTRYQKALNQFKKDYDTYADILINTLRIKCKTQPEKFYGYLEEARLQRSLLTIDITLLSQIIDEYKIAAQKLSQKVQS